MMDLIVTLRKSLIKNDLTKIRHIESVCLNHINGAIACRENNWVVESLQRDLFASTFLTSQIKNKILGDVDKTKYTVIAAK